MPRLLTIMGSGETAPTMVKVHRLVTERLSSALGAGKHEPASGQGSGAVRGILLDTPFGFQTNADEIGVRATLYFAQSVGAELEVAGVRTASDLEGEKGDRIVGRIAELPLVFAGPGSPSYALRHWRGTLIPPLLSEKLEHGGAITFASAAALTLGSSTVPVYEIYKVGEDPHWLEGLDLLGPLGIHAVVIPHYDNAEGQTHDTRYCYLGEERLSSMESELEEGTFVLGVDEHTALCLDLDTRSGSVLGRGGITVRVRGRSARVEAGGCVSLETLTEIAEGLRSGVAARPTSPAAPGAPGPSSPLSEGAPAGPRGSPLLQAIHGHEAKFRAARDSLDAARMVEVILALEEEMWAWRADTLQSDEMDRGRASLRAMVSDLGRIAEQGTRDPAEVIGPYVEVALSLREASRLQGRFEEADEVRDRLEALGVNIHDTRQGPTWEMKPRTGGDTGGSAKTA